MFQLSSGHSSVASSFVRDLTPIRHAIAAFQTHLRDDEGNQNLLAPRLFFRENPDIRTLILDSPDDHVSAADGDITLALDLLLYAECTDENFTISVADPLICRMTKKIVGTDDQAERARMLSHLKRIEEERAYINAKREVGLTEPLR